jgi:biopolymer transport protein ExbB/TolQ
MDADILFMSLFFAGLITFILSIPASITACIAWSNTKKWNREKNQTSDTEEAARLVDEPDDEQDFIDEEDEAFHRAKDEQKRVEREEREADLQITTTQKFFKEWKKIWNGVGAERVQREREIKEGDERRKIAREAVREYLRIERRRARKAQSTKDGIELPTYGNAIAEGAMRKE